MSRVLTVTDLHGEERPLWFFDWETYYNTKEKYSLRSMTVTVYVRDPRFKAHCLAAISPEGIPYSIVHDDIPDFLAGLDWKNIAIGAHNTAFDAFINTDVYGRKAAAYVDTLSMSLGEFGHNQKHSLEELCKRLGIPGKIKGVLETTDGIRDLDPETERNLADYALVDVERALQSYEIMMERGFPLSELHVIDTTIKAMVHPYIEVDVPLLRAEIEEDTLNLERLFNLVVTDIDQLEPKCRDKFAEKGLDGVLASSPCFAALLRQRGVEPPMKPSPSDSSKQIFAFGKTDLGLQELQKDPRVSALVDARLGVKSTIRRTRAERFLLDTCDGTKPLPVPLKYCGARTHRWSGQGSINLQNLPSGKGGSSSRLRQSLRAPKGYRLCVVDSSQIECRFNAWVWGQQDLLDIFASGGDPYSQLASELYKVPVGKHGPNKHLRPHGKAMELGLGYGMADEKFHTSCITGAVTGEIIDIDKETATRAVETYRNLRGEIVKGWGILNQKLNFMSTARKTDIDRHGPWIFYRNAVELPNQLMMHFPGLGYYEVEVPVLDPETGQPTGKSYKRLELQYKIHGGMARIWGSKFDENLVQSSTRTIVAERAMEIAREFPVLLLVHDEVVYLVPEREADEALQFGLDTLRVAPSWCPDIPLDAEGGHSERYDVK